MSEISSYIVRKPVLWFEAIGKTAPDAPLGFPESGFVVYRSSLAQPGDSLHLVDGHLAHQSVDGHISRGALRIGNGREEIPDMMRLVMSGSLAQASDTPSVSLPGMPAVIYPAHHDGIVRNAVSSAFATMMDRTEELRLECYESGEWSIICADYGVKRTVTFAVAEAETGLPVLHIELDPVSDTADITVVDPTRHAMIVGALSAEGISLEGRSTARVCGWNDMTWDAVQTALQESLFERIPVRTAAMAI